MSQEKRRKKLARRQARQERAEAKKGRRLAVVKDGREEKLARVRAGLAETGAFDRADKAQEALLAEAAAIEAKAKATGAKDPRQVVAIAEEHLRDIGVDMADLQVCITGIGGSELKLAVKISFAAAKAVAEAVQAA
jgi:hypothetical protein